MVKKKKDAKSAPSTDENALDKVESFDTKETGTEATSTPESKPGAAATEEEEGVELREDDASLKNQLGEEQRRRKELESRNEKLEDDVITMVQQQQQDMAQRRQPQADVGKGLAEELEDIGLPGEAAPLLEKRMQKLMEAQMQNTLVPAQQMNHDSLTRTAVSDQIRADERLKPYEQEINDMVFKKTEPGSRLLYTPEDIAEEATARVFFRHKDEIVKSVSQGARREAESDRQIEGESLSGASVTLDSGEVVELTQFEKDFCDERGWKYERLAKARERAKDNRRRALPEGA